MLEGRGGCYAEGLLGQVQLGDGVGSPNHDETQVGDGPPRGPHSLQLGQQGQGRNGHVLNISVVCDVYVGDVTVDCQLNDVICHNRQGWVACKCTQSHVKTAIMQLYM